MAAVGRLLVPAAVSAAEVAAAALVLGKPDLGLSLDFLSSTVPTAAAGVAAAQVLVWAATAVSFALGLSLAGRGAARVLAHMPATRLWAGAVMVSGLMILAAGLAHHYAVPQLKMAGGSVQEARDELTR